MRSSDALVAVCLLAGCPPGDSDPADDKEEFACEARIPVGESLVPLDGADAELVLGFQGFLYVPLWLVADEAPAEVDVRMTLAADGQAAIGGAQPSVPFFDTEAGVVSDEILLFLTSGTIDSWEGRGATITVRAEDARQFCVTSARVTLVDACEGCP